MRMLISHFGLGNMHAGGKAPPRFAPLHFSFVTQAWEGTRSGAGGGRPSLSIGQSRCFLKDIYKHLASEFAGIRILIGRVIRSQKDCAIRHLVARSVPEDIKLLAFQDSAPLQMVQLSVETNPS